MGYDKRILKENSSTVPVHSLRFCKYLLTIGMADTCSIFQNTLLQIRSENTWFIKP